MDLLTGSLTLTTGRQPILDAIDLAIPEGAVVGLVGRNGAGKSTLMRCLVGLTLPTSGSARLLGADCADLPDDIRARLGYVGQQPDLIPWLDVRAHLRYIGSFYPRWTEERALALCERLGLRTSPRVSTLSVGDQQKLAVVLAMAHDPDVLVLDEPVASLDPRARQDFMRLLFAADARPDADIARTTPRTVLLSSHLLHDLERVVSHVVLLHQGRVRLQGEWDALQEAHGCTLEDLFLRLCGDAAVAA